MYKKKQIVRTFEDLEVYKIARELSRSISKLIKTLPKCEEYNLKGQMRRAKLSVTNNIAEGFGRFHYQENIQFCRQSRGSICELVDDFNECYDEGYVSAKYRDDLKKNAYYLIKVLNGYISSLERLKKKNDV